MELQAIRDKLLSLQSEPSSGDVLLSPWAAPQSKDGLEEGFAARSSFGSNQDSSQSAVEYLEGIELPVKHPDKGETPQAIAIQTLKRRSGGSVSGGPVSGSQIPSNPLSSGSRRRASGSDADDDLALEELRQLEAIANTINSLSQQQTNALLQLKLSAQKAAISLRRQGAYDHPQLNLICQFLEQSSSVSVPNVMVDGHDQFYLYPTTINLNQAETEAVDNAKILRQQHPSMDILFTQPVTAGPTANQYSDSQYMEPEQPIRRKRSPRVRPKAIYRRAIALLKRSIRNNNFQNNNFQNNSFQNQNLQNNRFQKNLQNQSYQDNITPEMNERRVRTEERGRFSWIDGVIWFVGAAIIRIILNTLVVNYAVLKMPLLLILVGAVSYAIYRIVLSKSTDMSATYRVGTALLGLFLGSLV